jgi:hypothetical protein
MSQSTLSSLPGQLRKTLGAEKVAPMRASSSASVASSKRGAKQCSEPALKVKTKPTVRNFRFLTLRETEP